MDAIKENLLSRIYTYKYKGKYLNNYRDLIAIIKDVSQQIEAPGMTDVGIHLVIESRNHRLGMAYSKGYEMATELMAEIKTETQCLIEKLPKDFIEPLTLMNKTLTQHRNQLENNNTSWILIAEPWKYFILETEDSARLFVNDFDSNLKAEIPTEKHFNWKIKKGRKSSVRNDLFYNKRMESKRVDGQSSLRLKIIG